MTTIESAIPEMPGVTPQVMKRFGWKDAVLKPAVSALADGVHRICDGHFGEAQRCLSAILERSDAILQVQSLRAPDGSQ